MRTPTRHTGRPRSSGIALRRAACVRTPGVPRATAGPMGRCPTGRPRSSSSRMTTASRCRCRSRASGRARSLYRHDRCWTRCRSKRWYSTCRRGPDISRVPRRRRAQRRPGARPHPRVRGRASAGILAGADAALDECDRQQLRLMVAGMRLHLEEGGPRRERFSKLSCRRRALRFDRPGTRRERWRWCSTTSCGGVRETLPTMSAICEMQEEEGGSSGSEEDENRGNDDKTSTRCRSSPAAASSVATTSDADPGSDDAAARPAAPTIGDKRRPRRCCDVSRCPEVRSVAARASAHFELGARCALHRRARAPQEAGRRREDHRRPVRRARQPIAGDVALTRCDKQQLGTSSANRAHDVATSSISGYSTLRGSSRVFRREQHRQTRASKACPNPGCGRREHRRSEGKETLLLPGVRDRGQTRQRRRAAAASVRCLMHKISLMNSEVASEQAVLEPRLAKAEKQRSKADLATEAAFEAGISNE